MGVRTQWRGCVKTSLSEVTADQWRIQANGRVWAPRLTTPAVECRHLNQGVIRPAPSADSNLGAAMNCR